MHRFTAFILAASALASPAYAAEPGPEEEQFARFEGKQDGLTMRVEVVAKYGEPVVVRGSWKGPQTGSTDLMTLAKGPNATHWRADFRFDPPLVRVSHYDSKRLAGDVDPFEVFRLDLEKNELQPVSGEAWFDAVFPEYQAALQRGEVAHDLLDWVKTPDGKEDLTVDRWYEVTQLRLDKARATARDKGPKEGATQMHYDGIGPGTKTGAKFDELPFCARTNFGFQSEDIAGCHVGYVPLPMDRKTRDLIVAIADVLLQGGWALHAQWFLGDLVNHDPEYLPAAKMLGDALFVNEQKRPEDDAKALRVYERYLEFAEAVGTAPDAAVVARVAELRTKTGMEPGAALHAVVPGLSEFRPTSAVREPAGFRQAPEQFKVAFELTHGWNQWVRVTVVRKAAPHAADRFYNMIKGGYFRGLPLYANASSTAQFGAHPDKETEAAWASLPLDADPEIVAGKHFEVRADFGSAGAFLVVTGPTRFDIVSQSTALEKGLKPVGLINGWELQSLEGLPRQKVDHAAVSGKGDAAFEGKDVARIRRAAILKSGDPGPPIAVPAPPQEVESPPTATPSSGGRCSQGSGHRNPATPALLVAMLLFCAMRRAELIVWGAEDAPRWFRF